ncbi:MAG: tRNA (adenosine(37)-N6)-threonylcarbamoyltransferase complex dimerization subunit type 1 TsaB, partial [Candidatus Limnocylindrales bacterium]
RHAETILEQLGELLAAAELRPADLSAIVVGTGPGAFTGLRVGLATAKTLAHELDRPIVGIATAAALALAAHQAAGESGAVASVTVLQPAGPADRYVASYRLGSGPVEALEPPRLVAPEEPIEDTATLVAVDPRERAWAGVPAGAVELGRLALDGLGPALLLLGARRLASGEADDVAALVPTYVSLPRGASSEGAAWSPDLR